MHKTSLLGQQFHQVPMFTHRSFPEDSIAEPGSADELWNKTGSGTNSSNREGVQLSSWINCTEMSLKWDWFRDMCCIELERYLIKQQLALKKLDNSGYSSEHGLESTWQNEGVPSVLRPLGRFIKSYPFSLDPTRKFLRKMYHISKTSESTSNMMDRKEKMLHAFHILIGGMRKKKKHDLRSDSHVHLRVSCSKNADWSMAGEEEYLSYDPSYKDIAEAFIMHQDREASSSSVQYLMNFLPPIPSLAAELESLLVSHLQRDGRSYGCINYDQVVTLHEEIVQRRVGDTGSLLSQYFIKELERHKRYRLEFHEIRPIVSIIIYIYHIDDQAEQSIYHFFLISDRTRWMITPVLSGVIQLQQLFLSILCGGNLFLDLLSLSRRDAILDQWCYDRMVKKENQDTSLPVYSPAATTSNTYSPSTFPLEPNLECGTSPTTTSPYHNLMKEHYPLNQFGSLVPLLPTLMPVDLNNHKSLVFNNNATTTTTSSTFDPRWPTHSCVPRQIVQDQHEQYMNRMRDAAYWRVRYIRDGSINYIS